MTQTKDTTETTSTPSTDPRLEAVAHDLVELGSVWARYGLSIGRQALEASAKSLTHTANLLGQLADAVDGKKPEETKGAA
jgi:hypothetical protein